MRLLLDNLPQKLQPQRETVARCLEAFDRVRHVRAVYLFGSHARGQARPGSDLDLCIVADGAEKQLDTAENFRHELWKVWPHPPLTLLPISPQRLAEKRACGDHFFKTVLSEGVLIAAED